MIDNKRKPPYFLLLTSLIIMIILGYYVGGVALIEEFNVLHLTDYLLEIFSNPFRNYFHEDTVIFIIGAIVLWIVIVSQFQFRNFHFDKEHGEEQWADVKQLSKTLKNHKNDEVNRILTKNIHLNKGEFRDGRIDGSAFSNNNMLVIGSSGTYKTQSTLIPNLLRPYNTKIILDVKGDLSHTYGTYLKEKGVAVHVINLKEPHLSDRYNPFTYIYREHDLIQLISNLQASVKPPDAMKGDPFWDDGAYFFLQSLFYFEWLTAKDDHRIGSMNNIMHLVNAESKLVQDGIDAEGKPVVKTLLQKKMEDLAIAKKNDDYPPVRFYRKLKEGAPETVASIILIVNSMLKLCETADIKRIFDGNDFNFRELGLGVGGTVKYPRPDKKTVLFLVLPEDDKSYTFLINMIYNQLFGVLLRLADTELHGPLPIEVEFWMDEFYAGAKPTDPDVLLGLVRSRNIIMIPYLQSISQLKTLYSGDKWQVLLDNISTVMYLGSGPAANETHKWVSELLGGTTIDTRSEGESMGKNGSSSKNFQKGRAELMTAAAVKRMPREDCILYLEGGFPVYEEKALPWTTKGIKGLNEYARSLPRYEHGIRGIYNEEKMEYRTIVDKPIYIDNLTEQDIEFYKNNEATDPIVNYFDVSEEQFLYMNWDLTSDIDEEKVMKGLMQYREENLLIDENERFEEVSTSPTSDYLEDEEPMILEGTILELLGKYAHRLNKDQQQEIILGLSQELTEQQILSYFTRDAEIMKIYREGYVLKNKLQNKSFA